jgi:hypothetical protein
MYQKAISITYTVNASIRKAAIPTKATTKRHPITIKVTLVSEEIPAEDDSETAVLCGVPVAVDAEVGGKVGRITTGPLGEVPVG